MLATTIIDPLLSSPTQVQRHDTDMAATFEPVALPPPPQLDSLSYSSCSSGDDGDVGSSLYVDQKEQEDDCASPSVEQQQEVDEHSAQQHDEEEEEDITPFEQLMNRGNYLRQLRALELADEMERNATTSLSRDDAEEKKEEMIMTTTTATGLEERLQEDHVYTITTCNTATNNNSSNKVKVLEYNSYLAHQRYYDDLKHVDITYIDYGYFPHNNNSSGGKGKEEKEGGGRVVIEQRKRLGKGGFCWDAAFILGEHVISLEEEWNNRLGNNSNSSSNKKRTSANVLELGAGTGLCGIMIGKATNCNVTITDLPELHDLMAENVRRNFGDADDFAAELSDEERKLITHLDGTKSKGTVKSRVLRWGNEEDYFLQDDQQQQHGGQQAYDVIIGADIVASLYDPIALAQTLHALCGPTTKIYISSKSRLDKPHEEFDTEMTRLFTKVVKKVCPCSRLKTPNVFIIEAEGKRDII